MTHRGLIVFAVMAASVILPSAGASAQSNIYPSGTDCANQPTIAERLLCGRQEFRRQSETSQPVPPPGVDGVPEPQPMVAPTIEDSGPAQIELIPQERTTRPD